VVITPWATRSHTPLRPKDTEFQPQLHGRRGPAYLISFCSGRRAESLTVALRASVLERMASETGSDIEHGWAGMPASGEDRQWLMAPRQLIMASAAVIDCVTRRASGAVNRGELAMKIVFPARCVGNRHHNLVAAGTLSRACQGRRNVLMAHVTLGVWRGSLLAVAYAESRGVERGLDVSDMTYRNIQTGGRIRVARGANVHSELGRDYL
jgi:hypothetical protein